MTECKNFIFVEELIEGQQMLIDKRNQHVIPIFNARCTGDCRDSTKFSFCFSGAKALHIVPGYGDAVLMPLDPKNVLEQSKTILGTYQMKVHKGLTVGDLSVVSENKRKRNKEWTMKRINLAGGLTVGDLSNTIKDQRGHR